jgi:hypothetical protein
VTGGLHILDRFAHLDAAVAGSGLVRPVGCVADHLKMRPDVHGERRSDPPDGGSSRRGGSSADGRGEVKR